MRKLYFLIMLLYSTCLCHAQRSPKAITDLVHLGQSRTVLINVLSNDSNFNTADTVCVTNVWGGAGWASVQSCTNLSYHPLTPGFTGKDTFYYRACDMQQPTLCDTGMVVVTVTYLPPYHVNDTVTVIAGDTIRVYVLANDTNFNPQDSIRLTTIYGGTTGWSWIKDSTQVIFVTPDSLYYGLQKIRYRACDTRLTGLCDTGTLVVNVIRAPKANPDYAILIQPATAIVHVTANDSLLNSLDSSCITQIWGQNAASATMSSCGQVSFQSPTYDFFGQDTLYYRSCYTLTPSLCDTGMIVLSLVLPKPQLDFNYSEGPPCHVQAVNNSTLTDSVVWSVVFLTHNGTDFTAHGGNAISIAANMDSDFQATVCLQGFNAGGDSTLCYTFWIQCQLNTGINAITQNDLTVYPNPTTGRFTISLPHQNAVSYILTDISGRYILSGETTRDPTDLSIANLTSGIYLLRVGEQDKQIYKIVKE